MVKAGGPGGGMEPCAAVKSAIKSQAPGGGFRHFGRGHQGQEAAHDPENLFCSSVGFVRASWCPIGSILAPSTLVDRGPGLRQQERQRTWALIH
jgi:hypothetical protein